MTILNPHMLPKVRSKSLRNSCALMPCTARIASFVGLQCAPQNTVVPAHLPTIGKGVSTKVSDLYVCAACHTCHDIIDGRRGDVLAQIEAQYPAALYEQLMKANHETIARWVAMDVLPLPDDAVVI